MRFVLFALLWGCAAALVAQPPDAEVQVNESTPGDQKIPEVAALGGGGFVVVWRNPPFIGEQSYGVRGRLVDASGVPQGADIQVNSTTDGSQREASIAAHADGSFTVVWKSDVTGGSYVMAQNYDSLGSPAGGELDLMGSFLHVYPRAFPASSGGFIVVWGQPREYRVRGQRFDSAGSMVGAPLELDNGDTDESRVQGASKSDGSFALVWRRSTDALMGRFYDSSGSPSTAVIELMSAGGFLPEMGLAEDGSLMVAWNPPLGDDVVARVFDSAGVAKGPDFVVNSHTPGMQQRPRVVGSQQGFTVVWQSLGSPGNDTAGESVHMQRFDTGGVPIGSQIQVNTYTTGNQDLPAVTVTPSGEVAVAWGSDGSFGDDPNDSIQLRTSFVSIFYDGFESGDTGSWTVTMP